jgi:hypothetical protein
LKLRFGITILLAIGLLFAFVIGGSAIMNSLYCHPGPGTMSVFLSSYSPQSAMDSFEIKQFGGETGNGMSSGSGRRFVSNNRSIEPRFVIRSEQRADLMNALNQDLAAQLRHRQAEILSESGDASRGFHFTYRLGQNLGSATIAPFRAGTESLNHRTLPPGLTDVSGKITIAEQWFPLEKNAVQASLSLR